MVLMARSSLKANAITAKMSSPLPADAASQQAAIETFVEEGKKALALKDWNEASEKLSEACRITSELHGESSLPLAPILLSYAKAIFEIGVSNQGVLGKKGGEDGEVEDGEKDRLASAILAAAGAAKLVSSSNGEPGSSSNGGQSSKGNGNASSSTHQFAEEEDEEEEEDEDAEDADPADKEDIDEPEDEFQEAWQLLDVARGIYEKEIEDLRSSRMDHDAIEPLRRQLGEVYLLLGDVSTETEVYTQAAEDFKSALATFYSCLPKTATQIAAAHYKLAMVLESTPDGREEAIENVEKAIENMEARIKLLGEEKEDGWEASLKDAEGLLVDVKAKLDDLKTAPMEAPETSIAELMGNGLSSVTTAASAALDSAPINNLTSMVKKKAKKTTDVAQSAVEAAPSQLQTVADALVAKAEAIQQSAAELLEDKQKQAADVAESLRARATAAFNDAVKDGGELAQVGQEKAIALAGAIQSAAASAFDSVMEEGKAATKAAVEDVTETVEDIKNGSEVVGEVVVDKTQQGLALARETAISVADQIVEEGKATTKNTVEAVADSATEVMEGIENVGRAGKRKVDELRPDEADESAKKAKLPQ